MSPSMYLFLNQQLRMSTGKAAAQVAHAAVEAFRVSDRDLTEEWLCGGHYTKLVMCAESAVQLLVVQRYIEDRGFKTKLIIDEGRTEIEPFQATALGVEIVDKDEPHVAATFGSFRLYKDPMHMPGVIFPTARIEPPQRCSMSERFWAWRESRRRRG